jgi:hypothetical protein
MTVLRREGRSLLSRVERALADRLTRAFSNETAAFTTADSSTESALSPLPEQP